jgi:S-methylmethionine-dependent homocysteine/selenocysteine methylase
MTTARLSPSAFREQLQQRIFILDGAMGTMIQQHQLDEAGYRGAEFAAWPTDLKGNNDLLVLTQPELISEIHRQYLQAGADIIETNTFNATTIAMADYQMEHLSARINQEAAALAIVLEALPVEAPQIIETLFESRGWPNDCVDEAWLDDTGRAVWDAYQVWRGEVVR